MKVRIYDTDSAGNETLRGEAWLDDVFPEADDRFWVEQTLRGQGRCWVGGGAAPLVVLFWADRPR